MQAVADLAGRAVPAASTCGITLSENGHVITVASADAMARLLDEQQYELDTGPCLEALRTATVVQRRPEHRDPVGRLPGAGGGARGPVGAVQPAVGQRHADRCAESVRRTAHAFDGDSRSTAAQLTALAAATAHRRDAALRRGHPDRSPAHRAVLPVGDRPGHRHHHRHAALPPRETRSTCCAPCRRTGTSRCARSPPTWSPGPSTPRRRPAADHQSPLALPRRALS